MKVDRKEFEGNVAVSISEDDVRIWVCDDHGKNIFRFRALGRVYKGQQDITVIGSNYGKEKPK